MQDNGAKYKAGENSLFPMPEMRAWETDTFEKLERAGFDDPRDRRRFFAAGAAGSGFSRYTTRILPMCCTGEAPVRLQISPSRAWRRSRSSPVTRILIRSCALRLVSISLSSDADRRWLPTVTTGLSACARALSSLRSAEERDFIMNAMPKPDCSSLTAP